MNEIKSMNLAADNIRILAASPRANNVLQFSTELKKLIKQASTMVSKQYFQQVFLLSSPTLWVAATSPAQPI